MELNTEMLVFGGVAILLLIDKLIGALKSRGIDLKKQGEQVDELFKLHNVKDEDNVPVWYIRGSFEKQQETLAENLILLTRLIEKLVTTSEHRGKQLDEIHARGKQLDAIHTQVMKIDAS